jgi:excisionase family DNA binding protein
MPDKLPLSVSVPDAVSMTGIGRTTIYHAIKSGALPIRKCGRRTIIETSALNAWLASMPSQGEAA